MLSPAHRLQHLRPKTHWLGEPTTGRIAVAPDLGGRLFAELDGQWLHRTQWKSIANPGAAFNNDGGMNLWPGPEGGPFALNYDACGNWFVQPGINEVPFTLSHADEVSATLVKEVTLTNRQGKRLPVCIERQVSLGSPAPALGGTGAVALLAVETLDSIRLLEPVSAQEALICAWNLEQFDASDDTVAFGRVASGASAINFDYYAPAPHPLIQSCPGGFCFRVNGQSRGQIGLPHPASTQWIGFYSPARRLLCIKERLGIPQGRYFNIADNDQPAGPYSAGDDYSIFNSDAEMAAFELETIAPVVVEDGLLRESRLHSRSTYALYPDAQTVYYSFQTVLTR